MTRWLLQTAVLVALVAAFAVQIPPSALFFRPVQTKPAEPHAAFVTLDDATYARLMRRVRTAAWPGASRNWNGGALSLDAGALALEDVPPPPDGLELPEAFTRPYMPAASAFAPPPPLKPQSFAMPEPPPIPAVPATATEKRPAEELLDIDSFESLKERK